MASCLLVLWLRQSEVEEEYQLAWRTVAKLFSIFAKATAMNLERPLINERAGRCDVIADRNRCTRLQRALGWSDSRGDPVARMIFDRSDFGDISRVGEVRRG